MTKKQLEAMYKQLVGKRIARVEPNVFRTEDGERMSSDPIFVFDDGSTLGFVVDETEIGEYGMHPIVTKPSKRTTKKT